jgi:hypothetical protein
MQIQNLLIYIVKRNSYLSSHSEIPSLKKMSKLLYILCTEMFGFREVRRRHMAQGVRRSHHGQCVFTRVIDTDDDHLETGEQSD